LSAQQTRTPVLASPVVSLRWQTSFVRDGDFGLKFFYIMCGADYRALTSSGLVHDLPADPTLGRAVSDLAGGATLEGGELHIGFDLKAIDPEVAIIVVGALRWSGDLFDQRLSEAGIAISDGLRGRQVANYNLFEDAPDASALVFGELCRRPDGWFFRSLGSTFAGGAAAVASGYQLI
jgi:hypothetical protein